MPGSGECWSPEGCEQRRHLSPELWHSDIPRVVCLTHMLVVSITSVALPPLLSGTRVTACLPWLQQWLLSNHSSVELQGLAHLQCCSPQEQEWNVSPVLCPDLSHSTPRNQVLLLPSAADLPLLSLAFLLAAGVQRMQKCEHFHGRSANNSLPSCNIM